MCSHLVLISGTPRIHTRPHTVACDTISQIQLFGHSVSLAPGSRRVGQCQAGTNVTPCPYAYPSSCLMHNPYILEQKNRRQIAERQTLAVCSGPQASGLMQWHVQLQRHNGTGDPPLVYPLAPVQHGTKRTTPAAVRKLHMRLPSCRASWRCHHIKAHESTLDLLNMMV